MLMRLSSSLLVVVTLIAVDAQQRRQQPPPPPPPSSARGVGSSSSSSLAATDILSQVSDVNPDGSFYTKYETANGITYEESGHLKQPAGGGAQEAAEQVQGTASWITDDGQRLTITWQADENGAVFQADHLPTPPPTPEIPPLIQRALDWIAANPASSNEGQYRGDDNNVVPSQPRAQPTSARRPPAPLPPRRRFQ